MLTTALTALLIVLSAPLLLYWVARVIAMLRLSDAAFDAKVLRDLHRIRRLLR